jgi:hypothetical protein
MPARLSTPAVLTAWCLLAGADAGSAAGYYDPVALLAIGIGFAVLAGVVACGGVLRSVSRRAAILPLAVSVGFAIDDATRPCLYQHGARLFAIESLEVVTAFAASLLLLGGPRWRRFWWWVVALLAAATGIVIIVLIRNPNIDVWQLLQQSSTGLLHGDDMYRQHWSHSTGLQAVYPYLPWSTVFLAPFRWLFLDVRFGLLAALLAAAWLVRRSARAWGPLVSCLLLVSPGWVLLVNRSWTEPLLVLLVGGSILAIRSGRGALAVVALAAALACKQHVVLLLPLFAIWPVFGLRRVIASVLLAVIAILPWLIAGPGDLWHDTVHANAVLRVKPTSLNVPAFALRHGYRFGFWLAVVFVVAGYLLVWARVRPRTPAGLALSCALVLWAFDLANKQTFFNHYQLPLGLLVFALALAEAPEPSGRSRTARPSAASALRGSPPRR